jgi:hypothetical protein
MEKISSTESISSNTASEHSSTEVSLEGKLVSAEKPRDIKGIKEKIRILKAQLEADKVNQQKKLTMTQGYQRTEAEIPRQIRNAENDRRAHEVDLASLEQLLAEQKAKNVSLFRKQLRKILSFFNL